MTIGLIYELQIVQMVVFLVLLMATFVTSVLCLFNSDTLQTFLIENGLCFFFRFTFSVFVERVLLHLA